MHNRSSPKQSLSFRAEPGTTVRHSGHVGSVFNHLLMQVWWNTCRHGTETLTPLSHSRQMQQSLCLRSIRTVNGALVYGLKPLAEKGSRNGFDVVVSIDCIFPVDV